MILSGAARMAGVMGWPVSHSRSPKLHGFWLEQYGIDGAYLPLPVAPAHFRDALRILPRIGFAGVLGGNILIGRADHFFVDGMTCETVLGFGQCFVSLGLTSHHNTCSQHGNINSFHSLAPFVGLVSGKSACDDKTLFTALQTACTLWFAGQIKFVRPQLQPVNASRVCGVDSNAATGRHLLAPLDLADIAHRALVG